MEEFVKSCPGAVFPILSFSLKLKNSSFNLVDKIIEDQIILKLDEIFGFSVQEEVEVNVVLNCLTVCSTGGSYIVRNDDTFTQKPGIHTFTCSNS